MNYILNSDKISITIASVGAELISAKSFDGYEYIWVGKENVWSSHSPVLFPICGRLLNNQYTYSGKSYDMKCHGFFTLYAPAVVSQTKNSISFKLTSTDQTLRIYPFDFSLILTYTINGNVLSVDATVENTGDTVLPFMYGAHPGFNIPMDNNLVLEDYAIDFYTDKLIRTPLNGGPFTSDKTEIIELQNGKIPLSEQWLMEVGTAIFKNETCHAKLSSEKGSRSIEMEYGDEFKYVCLWKAVGEEATYVCIEPWSGIPADGITPERFEDRPSMVRLAPGENKKFSYKIKFD